ncbi:hypothetical protein LSTR_LSTR002111 [Laodelphax striatellus]|uniref:Spaetzle domain-containing protein n=1 Tax=Laodelphax striatellus TaxID=195883 RepID=A0A482XPH5_LAOST|nr:hypothetical protein LSTR_LSTR002111 [Laodelphax striatellus]
MMGGEMKYFIAALLIVSQVNALNIGSIFTGKKVEGEDMIADEAVKQTARDPPSSRPPLIPALPHPEDHPLHHNNDPNHPINHLPFNQARPTITATKTVYVEVTSRVTKHPVCIEVQGVKPPCLAAPTKYQHGYNYHDSHRSQQQYAEEGGYFREGGQELPINPTAAVHNIEPTRILGGVSESAPAPSEYTGEFEDESYDSRSGRYLQLHSATPTAPLRSDADVQEAPEGEGRIIEQLLNRQPEVHYATKTLWVTKVEKFIDYRVTATLEVKNCVPSEFRFPQCQKIHHHPPPPPPHPHKPPHKPTGYRPQHQGNVHYEVPYHDEEPNAEQSAAETAAHDQKKDEKLWVEPSLQPIADDVSYEV